MQLPEDDETYLNQKGYAWQLHPDGKAALLVISDYPVNAAKYDRDKTDLLICIPEQYNNAALDMFWCDPPVKLKTGGYPDRADNFAPYLNRTWQRFSRHPTWRAGIDSVVTFLGMIHRELQKGS